MLAVLLAASGCPTATVFECVEDAECSVGGEPGFCDGPGYCSFSDSACPSGRRFGALAGMGLADECVMGASTSSGVDTATSGDSTTGEVAASDGPGSTVSPQTSTSSGTTGTTEGSSTGEAVTGSSSDASSSSSSGGSDPCTVYDFDGAQPFEEIAPPFSVDVAVVGGVLRATWEPDELAAAALRIADPVNVSGGTLEVEFAEFPQEEGTVLSARWEDPNGAIVSAFVDGDEFLVSYTGDTGTVPVATEAHSERPLLRIRSEGDLIVVAAGDRDDFQTLATLDTAEMPFDLTEVDVRLVFDRYLSSGAATSIALESVTSCSIP